MRWPARKITVPEAIRRIYDNLMAGKPDLPAYLDDEGRVIPGIEVIDRQVEREAHQRLCEGFKHLRLWADTLAEKRGDDPDCSEVDPPPSNWIEYQRAMRMRPIRNLRAPSNPSEHRVRRAVDRLLRTELDRMFVDDDAFDAWLRVSAVDAVGEVAAAVGHVTERVDDIGSVAGFIGAKDPVPAASVNGCDDSTQAIERALTPMQRDLHEAFQMIFPNGKLPARAKDRDAKIEKHYRDKGEQPPSTRQIQRYLEKVRLSRD